MAFTYVGKTGRAFCTRCKEHMHDVNPKNLAQSQNNDINNKSALVKHVYSQNHHMDWNNSKILAKGHILYKKKIFKVLVYSF